MASGGGFTAGLATEPQADTSSVEFLASQHYYTKRGGITLDSTAVTADADGNKIVKGGTVLSKDDATGKYVPYADPAGDGTGGTGDAAGLLFAGDINLAGGDVVAGLLMHGSVLEARCTGVTQAVKESALASRITFQ